MKNWKTTVLGILGAGLLLATSKGWIDNDLSIFIGSAIVALFGLSAKDSAGKEDIGGGGIKNPPKP
jgi:hypothetical protein